MLEARDLMAGYAGRPVFQAVNLRIARGDILGLRGRSGVGKTTLGRVLAGLHPPMAGTVTLGGQPIRPTGKRPVQYLHQNPLASMNPRWRIARILSEAGRTDTLDPDRFGVKPDWLGRFPHELSEGQLQRVSVLRALMARPRFLIADEISTPLDPVSQVGLWQLLQSIAASGGPGILAISHDAALLDRVSSAGFVSL